MKLFSMVPGEDSATLYLPNEDIIMEHVVAGLRLGAVRSFFDKHAPLRFQAIRPDGISVLNHLDQVTLPDLMAWSWLPVLSTRARDLALQMGCELSDFFACRIDIYSAPDVFVHVPKVLDDVVDFARSTFEVESTKEAPVPFGLNQLIIKPGVWARNLKPCWRPMMAHPDHMAGELMVREDFACAWKTSNFTGAAFRLMAEYDFE